MLEPKNLKELHGLQGRWLYIKRFMSKIIGHCHPFSHLIKNSSPFAWDESCHAALEKIKKYLPNPPMLGVPIPEKPLIIYIAAQAVILKQYDLVYIPQRAVEGENASRFLGRSLHS